jgi:hypothetical protein
VLLAPLPAAMAQQPLIGSVDFPSYYVETLTFRVSKSFKLGNGTLFLKRNLIGFLLLTPIPYILCCGGVTRWPREIPFVSAPLHKNENRSVTTHFALTCREAVVGVMDNSQHLATPARPQSLQPAACPGPTPASHTTLCDTIITSER